MLQSIIGVSPAALPQQGEAWGMQNPSEWCDKAWESSALHCTHAASSAIHTSVRHTSHAPFTHALIAHLRRYYLDLSTKQRKEWEQKLEELKKAAEEEVGTSCVGTSLIDLVMGRLMYCARIRTFPSLIGGGQALLMYAYEVGFLSS